MEVLATEPLSELEDLLDEFLVYFASSILAEAVVRRTLELALKANPRKNPSALADSLL